MSSEGKKEINKQKLVDLIFSPTTNTADIVYFTRNSDDSFYTSLYSELKPAFNLTVVSTILIDDNGSENNEIKYQKLKKVDLYHLPDNISIDIISQTIITLTETLSKKFNRVAVLCPAFFSVSKKKIVNVYYIDTVLGLKDGTDFLIDVMLDEKLRYITLADSLLRLYYYDNFCVKRNIVKGNYYRLISEIAFMNLSSSKKNSVFELYLSLLRYNYGISGYFNDILKKNNVILSGIAGYEMNLFPTIIHYKLSRESYKTNVISSIVSVLLNNPDYSIDFIDFKETYEDINFDYLNRITVSKFLYQKYGASTSLIFYIKIIIDCMNSSFNFNNEEKILSNFADKNFVNKSVLYRIFVQIKNLINLGMHTNESEKIKFEDSDYSKIRSMIISLYEEKFINYGNKYVSIEGSLFDVNDTRIIHNWNIPLPKKIIPLVIKDKFIYLWEVVD